MRVPKTASRKISFCAGHRVLGHEGKCAQLHGHGYTVIVTARKTPTRIDASELLKTDSQVDFSVDGIGRVIDFSVLKDKIGSWIDANWDHGMILNSKDGDAIQAVSMLKDNKLFILPFTNPTAENLAGYLLQEICPMVLKGTGVDVVHVRVWETENCFADAREL